MRIIAGRHRGRRLRFVPGAGLRPTPDRVRETLFNWLRDDIAGAHCLDLFAGSGALGFEALSRGAASVTLVELNARAAQRLRDNVEVLREDAVHVVRADALKYLDAAPARAFDVVFVDPPFADDLTGAVCERLCRAGWLSARAVVYLEQDGARAWPEPPGGWAVHREGMAGQTVQRLLRRNSVS